MLNTGDLNRYMALLATSPSETVPADIETLPPVDLTQLAKEYISTYSFAREFQTYCPVTLQPFPSMKTPDGAFKTRAKAILNACIDADRSQLASVLTSSPEHCLKEFILDTLFAQRDKLEELATRYGALLELVKSTTRTSSACDTPLSTGSDRDRAVVTQVKKRDKTCRTTGVYDKDDNVPQDAIAASLEVIHGLPYGMGSGAFTLVRALTGVDCTGWKADGVTNAFYCHYIVHNIFSCFQLYFEKNPTDGQSYIRIRTSPDQANPISTLRGIGNDAGNGSPQICHIGGFIDCPLRAPKDANIPDIEEKFFVMHRYIGNIYWMAAAADLTILEGRPDDYDLRLLSDSNFDFLSQQLVIKEFLKEESTPRYLDFVEDYAQSIRV